MQNKKNRLPDFFGEYKKASFQKLFFSFSFSLLLAFSLVSVYHGGLDTRWLLASVALVADSQYGADLIAERNGDGIDIILWTSATQVENIAFTLLSDPEKLLHLSSESASIRWMSGSYQVSRGFNNRDLPAGSLIMHITLNERGNAPISIVWVTLQSEGVTYNLTSKSD